MTLQSERPVAQRAAGLTPAPTAAQAAVPTPTPTPTPASVDHAAARRLNWLRAGVLGANDGIVSIAALVVGVAAASTGLSAIAVAGFAGLIAGALSMASGEYVSVSSQRDAERVLVARAHANGQGDNDEHHLTSAWHAAGASLGSFVVGGLIPLAVVLLTPASARVVATFGSVVVALALTGYVSARLGDSPVARAVARNVLGGGIAMLATYGIGSLVGAAF